MEFNLTITTGEGADKAAFADDPDELARIIRKVAYAVGAGDTEGTCRDANGNRVGGWSITEAR